MVFWGVLWFIIGLKCRIKALGHIPIISLTYLELSKSSPNLDPSTPYVSPKYLKQYKKVQNTVKEMLFLHLSKLWISKSSEMLEKTGTET